MNDLERQWAELLSNATKRAAEAGRGDIADYLNLRAGNDAIRQNGIEWLFKTLTDIAERTAERITNISAEREEPHSFQLGNSRMTGAVLRFRLGVRCLTLEAGWTRLPGDGIMRGGSLAAARITHFGIPKANMDLYLVRSGDGYIWNFQTRDDIRGFFGSQHLAAHFELFSEAGFL
jgi:hypothetical protein